MRVRRGIPVIAADGARLLLDHYSPVPGDPEVGRVVVWIRTPYGRKGIASIASRFAKAGAHVVVEAVRGTDGSDGTFDGVTFAPQDGVDIAAWLRARPWFGGTIVTWGVSALGYACWALAGLDLPEWRLAILQDAQSELRDAVIYPGGAFAGKVMLGYVHDVAWQARHPGASLPRTMLASVRGARRVKKVLAELPLGTADQRLVGHRVDHFQEWLAREHDDEYWKRFDLRRDVAGMPNLVHLASGWYDVCLSSVLADYRALREAGKRVRLVVGPWYHGRGVIDRAYRAEVDVWLRAAATGDEVDAVPVRVHVGGVDQWRDLPDWPPPGYVSVDWHLQPDGALAERPAPDSPPDRYRYDPAEPTPAVGGAMENFDGGAGAKDNRRLEQRADVLTEVRCPKDLGQ